MKHIHIAIMRKSWGLTQKILSGEKTAESRWYKNKYKPWGEIEVGDIIYFKDSGDLVRIKADVKRVLQFENLTPKKVKEILIKYAKADGLGIDKTEIRKYYQMFKDKRYCLIIFLEKAKKIKPFDIDKTGFGAMASWLTIKDLSEVKKD